MQAADNTAPSRLSLELRPCAGASDKPKLEKFGSFNGIALYDAVYFKTGQAALDEQAQKSKKVRRGEDDEFEEPSSNDTPDITSPTASKKRLRCIMKKPTQWPKDLNVKQDSDGKDIKEGKVGAFILSLFT